MCNLRDNGFLSIITSKVCLISILPCEVWRGIKGAAPLVSPAVGGSCRETCSARSPPLVLVFANYHYGRTTVFKYCTSGRQLLHEPSGLFTLTKGHTLRLLATINGIER